MSVSPAIRHVIVNEGGADEIQKVALSEGMTTLRLGAAKLVLQGVTSIAEVERIATE
jgi:type IV pilus assembly protein PilB